MSHDSSSIHFITCSITFQMAKKSRWMSHVAKTRFMISSWISSRNFLSACGCRWNEFVLIITFHGCILKGCFNTVSLLLWKENSYSHQINNLKTSLSSGSRFSWFEMPSHYFSLTQNKEWSGQQMWWEHSVLFHMNHCNFLSWTRIQTPSFLFEGINLINATIVHLLVLLYCTSA